MKFSMYKVLATTFVVLGGIIWEIDPSYAENTVYNLDFFDNSGSQVGLGSFNFDTSTSDCIQQIPVGDSCNQMNGLFVDTKLTNFSVEIAGIQWTLNDRAGQFWWDGTVKGAIANGGEILVSNQWFFGDQIFAGTFLDMDDIDGQNGGSWRQVLDFQFQNTLEGTWIAELDDDLSSQSHAIPEPLTILGTATAIGFGTFFKLKLK